MDLEGSPDLLVEPVNAAISAAIMWKRLVLNILADVNTEDAMRAITEAINGGDEGLVSRLHLWEIAREAIGA